MKLEDGVLGVFRSYFLRQFCSIGLLASLLLVQVYAGVPLITNEAATFQKGYSVSGLAGWKVTPFNKVASIQQAAAPAIDAFGGASLWAAGSSHTTFEYDASNNRIRQTLTRNGLGIYATTSKRITTYVGSYEREEHYNSSNVLWQIHHRHMVGGFLQIKRTETSGQSGITEQISYFLKDHLGSTTAVLDDAGAVVERPSFDAWGKTRNATTWADVDADTQQLSSAYTNRGYTGHEQLDEVGLVHMNGRIYDPEASRFLSPDPYIQDAEHSQNFNRYAYVLNNPLSYTDPSGYFIVALFAAVVSVISAVVSAVATAVIAIGQFIYAAVQAFISSGIGQFLFGKATGVINAFFKGATWGGINGAVNGARGSDLLRAALIGGVTASIATGVLHPMGASASTVTDKVVHAVGHGLVGGAANVAMGGKFQDGFLSGFAGAAAGHLGVFKAFENTGMWGRTITAGVIGGVVSEIGGGKFFNGAYTAAFMHFFNREAAISEVAASESGGKWGEWYDPRVEAAMSGVVDEISVVYTELYTLSEVRKLGLGGILPDPSAEGAPNWLKKLEYSGQIRAGYMTVSFKSNGGDYSLSIPVMSGGYRTLTSRIMKPNDTIIPSSSYRVSTQRSGGTKGYLLYNTGNRNLIKIHHGSISAGCIVTSNFAYRGVFEKMMANTHKAGRNSVSFKTR